MLLITAVSVVFTSGALQEKVHYQYGADEQFVMSEDQNFVILLLDTVDSRTITELLDEHRNTVRYFVISPILKIR